MKSNFRIATINPFWRYAVVPENNCAPGIPFYSLAGANKFFDDAIATLPWAGCFLVKRHFFRNRVEVIAHHLGRGEPFATK